MIERINFFANALMTLASGMFYLMIFTGMAPGFDASRALTKRSYWIVRIGLSFFVAGSLFSALTLPSVSLAQLTRNLGMALLFSWAAVYHAKKWGMLVGIKGLDRKTGTFPVVK